MPYIKPEVVQEAKRIDLLTYLQNYEPDELVRISGNVYRTRTHDSLKISNGLWAWHSRGIGGRSALDYLIKVRDMGFLDAVKCIMGQAAVQPPAFIPAEKKRPEAPFVLPEPDAGTREVKRYLEGRGISRDVIRYCIDRKMLYQTRNRGYANAVLVGRDTDSIPRYATVRATRGNFKGDVSGSDKRYSFSLGGGSENLHLFESAVDLLSFATLEDMRKPESPDGTLLSLSGVYKPRKDLSESTLPPALAHHLKDHPDIRRIFLHLDNDLAGRRASEALMAILAKRHEVTDEPPPTGKDYNDYLCERLGLSRDRTKPLEPERRTR
jgi:hypothetical protein